MRTMPASASPNSHRYSRNPRMASIMFASGHDGQTIHKSAAEKPWTTTLWIYDLHTNKHFTLKEPSSSEIDWRSVSPKRQRCSADQNPLKRSDLDDFVACYNPKNRHERKESDRFKSFTHEDLTKRDKLNLDIFWLKDESLEDSANLRDPRHHRRRNR